MGNPGEGPEYPTIGRELLWPGAAVGGTKSRLGTIWNLVTSPVRLINAPVKEDLPSDPDEASFAKPYLDLADRALRNNNDSPPIAASPSIVSSRLRLEPGDGSPVKEYRINNGEIEVCVFGKTHDARDTATKWRRLTAAKIAHHVEQNTILSHWLERKLGWRYVLRKCVQRSEDRNQAA